MQEIKITKKLFGGKINFIIYNTPKNKIKQIMKNVYIEAIRLEKIFNLYDKKSEISKLNKLRKLEVSEEFLSVLKKGLEFSKLTMGSYDISLGKYILLRKSGNILIPKCSYRDILIKKNIIILKNPEVIIDLGSIAKGYITDKLAKFLEKEGINEFLIDSRGDICVHGKNTHVLGIKNPRKSEDVLKIKLKNNAVATSGDYMQYNKNFEMSHIINQNSLISVSIIAKTLEIADIFATAIFSSKGKIRKKLIKLNKNIKILTINNKNEIKMFNNFKSSIYK